MIVKVLPCGLGVLVRLQANASANWVQEHKDASVFKCISEHNGAARHKGTSGCKGTNGYKDKSGCKDTSGH